MSGSILTSPITLCQILMPKYWPVLNYLLKISHISSLKRIIFLKMFWWVALRNDSHISSIHEQPLRVLDQTRFSSKSFRVCCRSFAGWVDQTEMVSVLADPPGFDSMKANRTTEVNCASSDSFTSFLLICSLGHMEPATAVAQTSILQRQRSSLSMPVSSDLCDDATKSRSCWLALLLAVSF